MSITLDGTNGITTPDITSSGALGVDASAPDNSLVVDASGNVGIGTSSPLAKLNVAGQIRIDNNTTDPNNGSAYLFQQAGIGWNIASTNIAFTTGTSGARTERMRIDSSGNLLVGTTSTSGYKDGKFNVNGYGTFSSSSAGTPSVILNNDAGSGTRYFTNFVISGSVVGAITSTGTTTTYGTSSDYRLKENIAPMTGALSVVSQLKPVTYTWKADGSAGQGFIAHELQAVVPDCVTGEKDAVETYTDEDGNEQTRPVYQGIDTSFLVATLTAAIQEQQAIIDALTTRIEALENPA